MEVKNWSDPDGCTWREVIYKSYEALKDLKEGYDRQGYVTLLNRYDPTKWILTINMGKNVHV